MIFNELLLLITFKKLIKEIKIKAQDNYALRFLIFYKHYENTSFNKTGKTDL
jgi:hypothetical protein